MQIKRIRFMMGCFVTVEASHPEIHAAEAATEAAFTEMKRIEKLLSKFSESSVTSQINRLAELRPVTVSEEVFDLLLTCKRISEETGGAFDVTLEPLTRLWQHAEKKNMPPTDEEIQCALSQTGSRHLMLDAHNKTVFFSRPGMQIDFGAAGKGYAIDCAVRVLREWGVTEAVVSSGSTIFYSGKTPTRFGIQDPANPRKILEMITLHNNAVSTSGQTERFVMIRGRKFGHIINPRTGYPAAAGIGSVSVVRDSAMDSDILSTAAYIQNSDGAAHAA